MDNTIPTAEEFRFSKLIQSNHKWSEEEIMIEFARLHVEAALKAVVKEIHPEVGKYYLKDDGTILNAYPLTLIK